MEGNAQRGTNVVAMPAATTAETAAAVPDADLRLQVRQLLDGARYTQSRVAKEVGISPTAISQWLSGSYAGDNEAIESKVLRWLQQLNHERAAQAAMPAAPEYVETPSGLRILAALRYAQVAGDIAVIYGGAGLSKTSSIQHYRRAAPNVWHATMTPASASVVTALEEIAEAVGTAGVQGGGAQRLHKAVCRRVADTAGLLVIDEAQHLSTAALDQIRSIHDATGVGAALVGNEQVYARMTGGNRVAFLDRLFSRIGKKVRLVRAIEGDVDALIGAWGIAEPKCRATLMDIASKPGALRGLTKVLRLAAVQAAAEARTICCADVKTAWRELGGVE